MLLFHINQINKTTANSAKYLSFEGTFCMCVIADKFDLMIMFSSHTIAR